MDFMSELYRQEENKIIFEIWGKDCEKVRKFTNEHNNCFDKYHDVTGMQFSYTFTPSTVGMIIIIECSCGEKLTVGDFMK